jgi:hypothetical protein
MKSLVGCYGDPQNGWWDSLENQNIQVDFSYGPQALCDSILDSIDLTTSPRLYAEMDGKRGMLKTWSGKNAGAVFLCFNVIGDGKTGLHLLIKYDGKEGSDMAKQIVESIEFR